LSLVVGILVDDAIVVLENIYRHMEMGKSRIRASYEYRWDWWHCNINYISNRRSVLPIALSSGLVSNIITQFYDGSNLNFIITLASFTIIPWLSSRFGKLEHIEGNNLWKTILGFESFTRFTNWITEILEWCLNHYINYFVVMFSPHRISWWWLYRWWILCCIR
jgi:HAE1 family hydrophobic/amphiphilic exporter-1